MAAGYRAARLETTMPSLIRLVVLFVFLLHGAAEGLQAQQRILIPEKLERPTTTDDKGVVQWAPWKGEKCPNCQGAGKHKCFVCERLLDEMTFCIDCKRTKERLVTCRMCNGTGALVDPLETAPCPGCRGASFLLCTICQGTGKGRLQGEKNWGDCVGCRGAGGWKCGGCNGNRFVEPPALKPSWKDATPKDLAKLQAAADAALKELEAVTPAGGETARKEVKALVKAFDTASAFPAMKRLGKPFEDYLGKIYAGRNFQGYQENEARTMTMVKECAVYYLKHQKRMLELMQKRAEANAKLAGEQKGK
jgi:hypothetical protein